MKRILGAAMLVLLTAGMLAAQTPSDDEYIKAMQISDPCQKVAALKAWLGKYAGKGAQYENFANAWITLTPCKTTTPQDAVQHGEKALALGGIDDATKVQLLPAIATHQIAMGQSDRAKATAQQLIDMANTNRQKDPSQAAQWTKLVGAGRYVQGQAAQKAGDYAGAAEAYMAAYAILKNPQIVAELRKLGKELYDKKQFAAAEKIYREFYAQAKDAESAIILGQTLYEMDRTDEALGIFKEAYGQKKTGNLAYNIGIIVAKQAKTDPAKVSEAINYLLEAHFLSPANSQNAATSMNLAQSLFFTASKDVKYNEIAKQMQEQKAFIDELTAEFNKKFGGKDEEDLSDAEKRDLEKLTARIEEQNKELAKLEAAQKVYIDKFNTLVAQVKSKLGK